MLGLHFMNPVPLMPLVELDARPGDAATRRWPRAMALTRALGKTGIESADYPGFIANRILMPMINEAVFALMEGVGTAEAIDGVMKLGMNHPMGPLTLADFIGLDVCLAILDVLHDGLGDPKYRACPLLRRMVAAGHLGRKSRPRLLHATPERATRCASSVAARATRRTRPAARAPAAPSRSRAGSRSRIRAASSGVRPAGTSAARLEVGVGERPERADADRHAAVVAEPVEQQVRPVRRRGRDHERAARAGIRDRGPAAREADGRQHRDQAHRGDRVRVEPVRPFDEDVEVGHHAQPGEDRRRQKRADRAGSTARPATRTRTLPGHVPPDSASPRHPTRSPIGQAATAWRVLLAWRAASRTAWRKSPCP